MPVLNDAGFRVECYDAADVGKGPLATLACGSATLPFLLHSAWIPRAAPAPDVARDRFSSELARVGELPDDLAAAAREVARELDRAASRWRSGTPVLAVPRRCCVASEEAAMHDLVIRGGTVVDGSGAPAREADVAIDGERIVAVGARPGRRRGARSTRAACS